LTLANVGRILRYDADRRERGATSEAKRKDEALP
jgi:hypothetical protein